MTAIYTQPDWPREPSTRRQTQREIIRIRRAIKKNQSKQATAHANYVCSRTRLQGPLFDCLHKCFKCEQQLRFLGRIPLNMTPCFIQIAPSPSEVSQTHRSKRTGFETCFWLKRFGGCGAAETACRARRRRQRGPGSSPTDRALWPP